MRKVVLNRLETSIDDGTLGALFVSGKLVCFTVEPPMNHNKVGESCIPVGEYIVKRDNTGKHRYWAVQDVYGRKNIEIHLGNTKRDTTGCIIVGSRIGSLNGQRGLIDSKSAMELFNSYLVGEDEFLLIVRSCLQ